MKSHLVRRLGVMAAGASLTLGALAPAAHADTTPSTTLGNTWLKGELVDNLQPNQYGPDYGLSIDAAFTALAAGDTTTAVAIRDAVAAHIGDYITGEAFSDPGSTYAGPTAKALVLAERTGADPRSFGGVDLVARLEAQVQTSGGLRDTSTFGNFANTLGQAFAVEGLSVAGSAKAPAVRGFLLQQQCGAGFFRSDFDSATDTTCTTATAPVASVDATGLATAALVGGDATSTAAVNRAVTWLSGTAQQADGSFDPTGTATGVNANSTGLAGIALGAACAVPAADKAASAIRALQVPTTGLPGDRGAIALDAADAAAARATGVSTTAAVRDRYRRATAQAAPALTFDPAAAVTLTLTGPTAPVKAGSKQTLTISGASKGETVCLTTPTGTTRLVGTGAALSVPVTAPTSGVASYAATTGPGSTATTVTAAPRTVLKARTNGRKFARGARVKVKISGLTAGQKVVVKLRGKVVEKTRADGVNDKVTFRVSRGIKPGKATVKVKAGKAVDKIKVRIKR